MARLPPGDDPFPPPKPDIDATAYQSSRHKRAAKLRALRAELEAMRHSELVDTWEATRVRAVSLAEGKEPPVYSPEQHLRPWLPKMS